MGNAWGKIRVSTKKGTVLLKRKREGGHRGKGGSIRGIHVLRILETDEASFSIGGGGGK